MGTRRINLEEMVELGLIVKLQSLGICHRADFLDDLLHKGRAMRCLADLTAGKTGDHTDAAGAAVNAELAPDRGLSLGRSLGLKSCLA